MVTLEEERRKAPLDITGIKEGWDPEIVPVALSQIKKEIKELFPCLCQFSPSKKEKNLSSIGVLFSGGQASGGHNVILGLFEALKALNPHGKLLGFLGGPKGLMQGEAILIDEEKVKRFRNMGGFHMIGSGRDKIEKEEELAAALKVAIERDLDGLVIIGGDDSNTNAAHLAEYFLKNGGKTKVIGVPKTIDGDLKNEHIEISFGFDTACKVYSEMIGNIATDAMSARKYYHFIKLMGRSASHVALECALQTQVNYTLIAEEVKKKKWTLEDIISDIEEMILKRAEMDHHFGVILIPEGLIEFIPEMEQLIRELNLLMAEKKGVEALSEKSKKALNNLPKEIQNPLLMERDPHGNVQVSHIATERLILLKLEEKLKQNKSYKGKFSPVNHFLGYEGRAAFPSHFDALYCYCLGKVAAKLIEEGYTGYMALVKNLAKPRASWTMSAASLLSMMSMEMRKGKMRPVIEKRLVDLDGAPFKLFSDKREEWKYEPCYLSPGPIQFFGKEEVSLQITKTLFIEYK